MTDPGLQKNNGTTGAVLVVGSGIGGMQAALDLAESGYMVYLVERRPSIAGTMPMLDKTFPTNDCSMCILSPRVVDIGSHLNIEVITLAELTGLTGGPGNFTATIKKHPRFVDIDLCVSCGRCETACDQVVRNDFNQGLDTRKAIYKPYPQAFPNSYVIDGENCISCGSCASKCPRKAINLEMKDETVQLSVGAVILSPGFEIFDARERGEFGYGVYQNVVTSIEFERLLSASGPFQGHLVRPSDHREPRKVAFIQCVGSREPGRERNYCSGVCCMYATKEAIVAREHVPGLESAIFCIDVRAYGKGFEQYYERARGEYGVRYVKCMVSSVKEMPQTGNVMIRYRSDDGAFFEEEFDMAVLSVGLKPPGQIRSLADAAGIELDEFGFCTTGVLPGTTTRPGVFVAGTFAGPKDIPETVIDGSAAAGYASRLLQDSRGTLTKSRPDIPEKDVTGETPRVGVFVCNCGINIGSVIDVPSVVKFAKGLKGVVFAEEFLFACAQDSIEKIKRRIRSQSLNRIVVASCTPRTHAPLFMNAIREAGLNQYLYEHVNIREHSSWVHRNYPDRATAKARDLVKMAVSRAVRLSPIETTYTEINKNCLVVGGGASGMTAALSLAEQGFGVYLVEKENSLGGQLAGMNYTLDGLNPVEILAELTGKITKNTNIKVFTGAEVAEASGFPGNYRTRIRVGKNFEEIAHGAVILANGASEAATTEYMYGTSGRVLTQKEFEKKMAAGELNEIKNVVMIQCVGSRNAQRPYCSRICCSQAVKNALKIKKQRADTNVYVLYRDVRVYGLNEKYYTEARSVGVGFFRYDPGNEPVVSASGDKISVEFDDIVTGFRLAVDADVLVLSTGIDPSPDNEKLSRLFKVPLNSEGFLLEAHLKLRPVDFAADGLYLCGLAHSPKLLSESIVQSNAAAMRAASLLAKDKMENVAITAFVQEDNCVGCGICVNVCSYNARYLDEFSGVAMVADVLCQGCGACVAACPSGASQQKGYEKDQMMAMMREAL
ncbi:MAG: FAD-dependent oxidoreductase [Bacillota bacterium]